jgi:hypothetical protein
MIHLPQDVMSTQKPETAWNFWIRMKETYLAMLLTEGSEPDAAPPKKKTDKSFGFIHD